MEGEHVNEKLDTKLRNGSPPSITLKLLKRNPTPEPFPAQKAVETPQAQPSIEMAGKTDKERIILRPEKASIHRNPLMTQNTREPLSNPKKIEVNLALNERDANTRICSFPTSQLKLLKRNPTPEPLENLDHNERDVATKICAFPTSQLKLLKRNPTPDPTEDHKTSDTPGKIPSIGITGENAKNIRDAKQTSYQLKLPKRNPTPQPLQDNNAANQKNGHSNACPEHKRPIKKPRTDASIKNDLSLLKRNPTPKTAKNTEQSEKAFYAVVKGRDGNKEKIVNEKRRKATSSASQEVLNSSLAFITTFSQNKYLKRESSCEQNQLACGAQFKLENQKRMTYSIDAEHEVLRIPTQYGLEVSRDDFHHKSVKYNPHHLPLEEVPSNDVVTKFSNTRHQSRRRSW